MMSFEHFCLMAGHPRLGGLKSMRASRHHCAPKSLDSCRAKPERETQPEGAHDSPPTARRCRPNPSERADHAASAHPREYGGISLPFQTVQHLRSYPQLFCGTFLHISRFEAFGQMASRNRKDTPQLVYPRNVHTKIVRSNRLCRDR